MTKHKCLSSKTMIFKNTLMGKRIHIWNTFSLDTKHVWGFRRDQSLYKMYWLNNVGAYI